MVHPIVVYYRWVETRTDGRITAKPSEIVKFDSPVAARRFITGLMESDLVLCDLIVTQKDEPLPGPNMAVIEVPPLEDVADLHRNVHHNKPSEVEESMDESD